MQTINVDNYPIHRFECEQTLVLKVLEDIKNKDYQKIKSSNDDPFYSNSSMYNDYFHPMLFDFFEKCIKEIKTYYFQDHINFEIVDCWANRYNALQVLSNHTHSNSIMSGLFYLTTHEKDGATCFNIENPWFSGVSIYQNLKIYKTPKFIIKEIYPQAGALILFPSRMFHYVKPIKNTNEIRYTISFNCFPTGDISLNNTGKLTIKTTSVRNKFQEKLKGSLT